MLLSIILGVACGIITCGIVLLLWLWLCKPEEPKQDSDVLAALAEINKGQTQLAEIIKYRTEAATVKQTTTMLELMTQNDSLPTKILESIQGSISNNKGKVAELIAYLQLKANYDRIIPLGGIVDYIAIRFPTENDPGEMVFIDIKSGNARLSTDQKYLKKIIEANKIGFQKMTIDTSDVLNATTDNNSGTNSEVQ